MTFTRLEIRSPEGERLTVPLGSDGVSIGRRPEANAVALAPDPQRLVGRHGHCRVAHAHDRWWVTDGGSVNGTHLRRCGRLHRVAGSALLMDGDVICILGRIEAGGEPRYWELAFADPASGGLDTAVRAATNGR